MKTAADPDSKLLRVVRRAAVVGAVIATTWALLYVTLGVTTFSTILAVLVAGFASLFL